MRRAALAVLVLAAAGCAVRIPEPTREMAAGDETVLAELKAGRRLYINKCSGCHALYPVDRYDDGKWAAEVDEMLRLKKVKLHEEERRRLLRYLTRANDPE